MAKKRKRREPFRRMMTEFEEKVFDALTEADLCPQVYCLAVSGSCYFRFADKRLRSLRIGDHHGLGKYRYKWNLRLDYQQSEVENDHGVIRYYHPADQYEELVKHMKNYAAKILDNAKVIAATLQVSQSQGVKEFLDAIAIDKEMALDENEELLPGEIQY